jgi:hypothetical protein
MPDDYTRITHDLFRVRLTQPPDAEVHLVPGSVFPAKLVLVLQDRPELERALATPERGAILEVDMAWDVAAKVYEQIWRLSQTMGWPLPKLKEDQV